MIAHAMQRARGGHWLPQEMQARRANLRRGRAALGQQIERLTEAYMAGVVPLAEYGRRRRDAETRLSALDGQERELLQDSDRQGETTRLAAQAEMFCRRVREGLERADFDRKRQLLELLVDRVVVTDGDVEIRYVVPTGPDGERDPFCRLRTDYLHGGPGREGQRGRQVAPLAPGAHDVEQPVQQAPHVGRARPTAGLGGRDQQRDQPVLLVVQRLPGPKRSGPLRRRCRKTSNSSSVPVGESGT
jgi:hypothetical protein